MKIAAIALRGMTILPGMVAHFDISRDKSIKAVEAAMNNNQRIFLVTQRDAEVDTPKMADLFEVGIVAEIKQVIKLQNNIVRVLAEGESRARLTGFGECDEFLLADVEEIEDIQENTCNILMRNTFTFLYIAIFIIMFHTQISQILTRCSTILLERLAFNTSKYSI